MLYIRLTLICKSPQLAPKLRVSHVNLSGPEYEIEYRFYNEAIDWFLDTDNQYSGIHYYIYYITVYIPTLL